MATKVDILKLMDLLEKISESPAEQWKALREILKIQKSVNGKKAPAKTKRGRPRKDTQAVK